MLRYFLRVVSGLLDLTPANDPSQRYLVTRQRQCREQIHEVEINRFPGRWDPLLPRLLDDNDDLDSVVAETIVVTSDEEADEIAVPDRATRLWAPRLANVQVTSANPLIHRRPPEPPYPSRVRTSQSPAVEDPRAPDHPPPGWSGASSCSRVVPRPIVVGDSIRLPRKVDIVPTITQQITSLNILSIDWHQVLDFIRVPGRRVIRPNGYRVVDDAQQHLRALKDAVPDIHVVINSYCCSPGYRRGVLSVNCPEISHCIVSADKGGPIGKLAALKSVCRPTAHICHIDDSDVVLRDFKSEQARRDGWNVHPLGIRVPRSGCRRPKIRVEEVEGSKIQRVYKPFLTRPKVSEATRRGMMSQ